MRRGSAVRSPAHRDRRPAYAARIDGRAPIAPPGAFPAPGAVAGVRSTEDLARLLRELRRRDARRRGGAELTYRDLAAATGWSHGIIGGYLAGRVLPPTDRFDTLVRLLGASPAEQGALATARDQVEEGRRGPASSRSSPPRAPGSGEVVDVPRQLPADVPAFTGRAARLADLDRLLGGIPTPRATPFGDTGSQVQGARPRVVLIAGTAGVGKTALAVHWAHRVADRFPDGQLYVDLRGYDPQQPADAGDVLAGFLRGLGVPASGIPAATVERAARYRTAVAGRRLLVLLDNASAADQVRPLLPGTGTCVALVTSRDALGGLVARDGVHPIHLGRLDRTESLTLLRRLLGPGTGPGTAETLATRCAGLPLALRIAATRPPADRFATTAAAVRHAATTTDATAGHATATTDAAVGHAAAVVSAAGGDSADANTTTSRHPAGPPAAANRHPADPAAPVRHHSRDPITTASRHPVAGEDLDAFDVGGDPRTALRSVFSWSLRRLGPAAASVFRLLGLHPGRFVDAAAAAALAGVPPPAGRAALDELARAHLVEPDGGGYGMHDLLRAYSIDLAGQLPPEESRAALDRLAAHLLHTAAAAAGVLFPHDRPAPLPPPDVATPERAVRWLDRERGALVALARRSGRSGDAVAVSRALWRYLEVGGHYRDALAVHGAAAAHGDPDVLTNLGAIHWLLGDHAQATVHFGRSRRGHRGAGDTAGEARATARLALVHERLGDHDEAAARLREALGMYRSIGDRHGEAAQLLNLGFAYQRMQRHREAETYLRQAAEAFAALGDRRLEGYALGNLGAVESRTGRHEQALAHLRQALAHCVAAGDRGGEGSAHATIGAAYHRVGEHGRALGHLRRALAVSRATGECGLEVETLNTLGDVLLATGNPDAAARRFAAARALAERTGDRHGLTSALDGLTRSTGGAAGSRAP